MAPKKEEVISFESLFSDKLKRALGRTLDDPQERRESVQKMRRMALQKAGEEAIREIKRELDRHSFESPPSELKQSFEYEVKRNTIVITSDHPAATYLEEGVDDHQMDYLTKSASPIPIMKDNGEVIFREATPQTMADGKWMHPGIQGMHFIEKAIERAKETVREEMAIEYRNFLEKRAREIVDNKSQRLSNRIDDLYN